MHELAPLVYDLAIMLGLAGIVTILFQRIHQPVVLGYLVAGVIIGPYIFPALEITDKVNISTLSELGVIFLMFSLGLEFSFQKLTQVGFTALGTGVMEVILMAVIGFAAGHFMGWSFYDALFLGAALSISSTTIIIKAIDELKLKTKRFAELIFGILIVEDLLAILLLVALSTIVATHNIFSLDMLTATAKLILVVGSWFLFGYFLMPPLFRKFAEYISDETLTIIAVALCLILVCIAARFHYSAALGAFIMGSILSETILIHRIESLIRPIRDIFAAVFFISVGMLINPMVIIQHWDQVLILTLVTVIGKILTTTVSAVLTGQSVNTSLRIGFGMAQVGEFSFIIVALGMSLGVTNSNLYPLIVAVSGVTTFTTPYLIRISGKLSVLIEKYMPRKTRLFLENYSMWVFRAQTSLQKNPHYKSALVRLFINGICVAIIFALLRYLLYRYVFAYFNLLWLPALTGLVVALICSAPFIWGMLFSFREVAIPDYAKMYLNPINYMIWFFTFAEVVILGVIYFHSLSIILLFTFVAFIFFGFTYKSIAKSYYWFEKRLVGNIKKIDLNQKRYAALAPWETHLVEIEVNEQSVFVGKTLGECDIRRRFGVNIVAICHGDRIFPAPRGDQLFMSHDRLVVLGNDQQLTEFTNAIETKAPLKEKERFLNNFTLKGLLVLEGHPLIGKTIRDSKIREAVSGLVVGLERNQLRELNPAPDTVIKENDLLIIVGEREKLNNMKTMF